MCGANAQRPQAESAAPAAAPSGAQRPQAEPAAAPSAEDIEDEGEGSQLQVTWLKSLKLFWPFSEIPIQDCL